MILIIHGLGVYNRGTCVRRENDNETNYCDG